MAADASKDAQVPVTLALARLSLLSNVEYISNVSRDNLICGGAEPFFR